MVLLSAVIFQNCLCFNCLWTTTLDQPSSSPHKVLKFANSRLLSNTWTHFNILSNSSNLCFPHIALFKDCRLNYIGPWRLFFMASYIIFHHPLWYGLGLVHFIFYKVDAFTLIQGGIWFPSSRTRLVFPQKSILLALWTVQRYKMITQL